MVFVIHCLRLPPMNVLRVELAWATWSENIPCCPCAGPGMLDDRVHELVGRVWSLLSRRYRDTMDRGGVVEDARFLSVKVAVGFRAFDIPADRV